MRRWSARALVATHLRDRPGASLTVAVLMVLLSAVAVLAPLALTAVGDAAMRERLTVLSTLTRDVIASERGTPQIELDAAPEPEARMRPWEQLLERLQALREEQPAPLRAVLGEPRVMTVTAGTKLDGVGREAGMRLLMSPQLGERVTVVAGSAPAAPPAELFAGLSMQEEGDAPPEIAPVDIMLSVGSAAELDLAVGDRVFVAGGMFLPAIVYRVSGLFEGTDPTDPFWDHAQFVLEPSITVGERGPTPSVVGVLDPGAVGVLLPILFNEARTEAWFPLDVDAITSANAVTVLGGLRELSATPHDVGGGQGAALTGVVGVGTMHFASEAIPVLSAAIGEARALAAVVGFIAAGPFGVAAVVLLLGCRMLIEQRRGALRLLTARGASPAQLRGLLGLQGLLVGAVPAVLGTAVALALASALAWLPGQGAPDPGGATFPWAALILPAILALTPAAFLVIAGPRLIVAGERGDLDAAARPAARRLRLLVETAVVVLAAVATVLLRSRGAAAEDAAILFDPLLAAAPLLLALVAGIVALRLYPLPLRAMLRGFRRSPGFIGFVGAARALREPAAGLAPALALIVGLSVAVASGVLLSTVQQGMVDSARLQVGADIKLEAMRFSDEQLARIAETEGVRAIATIADARATELDVDGKRRVVSAIVVDQQALEAVQPSGHALIPNGVRLQLGAATGSGGAGATSPERVPVLVSPLAERIWEAGAQVRLGEAVLDPAAVIDTATPLGPRSNWLVLDVSAAQHLLERMPAPGMVLVAAESNAAIPALAAALSERLARGDSTAHVRITTADSMIEELGGSASIAAVRIALLLCIALVALLGAAAVVITLVLGTRARERLLALLPSLGATRRSGAALAAWELWPAVASAVVVGSIFGAALPMLVLAAVDLRPFTGSPVQPAYVADPLLLGLAVGGFLLLATLLTAAALGISRRARAVAILRTMEEA